MRPLSRTSVSSGVTRRALSVSAALALVAPVVAACAPAPGSPTNLVRNPGFESTAAGWVTSAPSTVARVAGGASSAWALRAWTPESRPVSVDDAPVAVVGAHSGQGYDASVAVRAAVSGLPLRLTITETSPTGAPISSAYSSASSVPNTWQVLHTGYRVQHEGSTVDVSVSTPWLPASEHFDVDNVSLTPTNAAPGSCQLSSKLVPSCGALWGMYAHTSSAQGWNWGAAVSSIESAVGRQFDIVHRYHDMSGTGNNGAFPDPYERAEIASGHILFFAWESRNYTTGAHYTWADIASGRYDGLIAAEAQRIKATGVPVMMDFDHESDGSAMRTYAGPLSGYAPAYRHIHDVFARLGVTNVVWVWTVAGYYADYWKYPTLYPGDAYVDWIGYDPYNFAQCHATAWKSFDTAITGTYDYLMTHGYGSKPFLLSEYGSVPGAGRPAWMAGIADSLKQHPNLKAVVEWNSGVQGPAGYCDTQVTDDPSTLAAFAAVGHDPFLNVR